MTMMQRQNGPQNGTDLATLDDAIVEYQAPAVLGQQIMSEIEAQVSTARRYPRSIKLFRDDAITLATIDKDVAKSCMYSVPRKDKDGKERPITGPSVRLAEIIAACYGNLSVVARLLGDDTRFITAQATCLDVQRNVRVTIEVRRRITDRSGRTYSEDMIGVTGAAAMAIARRNAIFAVIPNALTKVIYDKCRTVARGDEVPFKQLRDEWVAMFVPRQVSIDRLLRGIGAASIDDMTDGHIDVLIGFNSAIEAGDITIDQAFPRDPEKPAPAKEGGSRTQQLKDKLKPTPTPNADAEDATPGTAEGQA